MRGEDAESTSGSELRNARQQLHIYEAIVVAADDAHSVLDAMLGASDPNAARGALQDRYGFTETQAWAVMDVQFRRMTAIDRQKIEQRARELAGQVAALEENQGARGSDVVDSDPSA